VADDGRNDPRVPFSEAEQIAAKVRGHSRTVWTIFADNEGHGFAKKGNADYSRAVEAYILKKSLSIE
jgi:dipeptidyl aminopeptidase/acylaminoacyl peptidase